MAENKLTTDAPPIQRPGQTHPASRGRNFATLNAPVAPWLGSVWADLVAQVHKGMISRTGVPLNGSEAFSEGFARNRCPYRGGTYPSAYWQCWMNEWSLAESRSRRPTATGRL